MKFEERYILSIGILTCEQPKDLKRTLESILKQIKPDIEIVVSDDSFSNETETMMQLHFSNLNIKYFRNKRTSKSRANFDKNILSTTANCSGEYVWWFGDDEFNPGAIEYALKVIKENPGVPMIYNNFQFNNGVTALSLKEGLIPTNEVLEKIANVLGFASAIIFKKDLILDVQRREIEKFIGSGFINFYLVLHILSKNAKIFYINIPLVLVHPTEPGKAHYDGFQVFGIEFYKIAINFAKRLDKASLEKMLKKNFGHVWKGIVVGWIRGYDHPKGKRFQILRTYWTFPHAWVALLIFSLPKFIVEILYNIYKKNR